MSTRKQVISLGVANAYNSALQFLLPVLLVRLLGVESFGYYKIFWLVVTTVMIFAPLGMPRSLHYFLPRKEPHEKSTYVYQTVLFLLVTALTGALLMSPLNPVLPERFAAISDQAYVVPAFILAWVIASLIEVLPSADQRVNIQASLIIAFATIRVAVIYIVAWKTADIQLVFLALLIFAVFKMLVMLFYVQKYHSVTDVRISRDSYADQFTHALPFGLTGMLNKMRPVSEQWVIAFLFTPALFGVFAIAAALMPLLNTLKKSVGFVTIPKMSKLQSEGKTIELLRLNNQGNVGVAFVMFPVVAFLFVFAHDFVTFLYTESYAAAAPVIKVYAAVAMILSIEVSSVLIVFRQGRFVSITSAFLILVAVISSYIGARYFGLAGGASGSLVSVSIATILYYRRVSSITGVSIVKLQQWLTLLKLGLAAFIACYTASILIEKMSIENNIIILVSATLISGLLYLLCILFSGDLWLLKAMAGKGEWQLKTHA